MRNCLEDLRLPLAALPSFLQQQTKASAILGTLIDAQRRNYQAGSMLKLAGEEANGILLVHSGWLLAAKSLADGQRQIIDVILPGDMLDPASADQLTSAVEIETLTDNSIALIPRGKWRRACHNHPELADLGHQLGRAAYSRLAERMVRLTKAPAETTIAFVFCELCLRSTGELIEGVEFHIPMTQQQLGDLCGQSAVHICRTLRRFKRNGVLSVTNRMDIVVHDMDALIAIAQIDLEELRAEIISAA